MPVLELGDPGFQRPGRIATPGAPLLTVSDVAKSYRRQPVLREVSLQAWPGQVLAITGENGSGKTTLLRICAGLEAPRPRNRQPAGRGRLLPAGAGAA